MSYLYDVLKRTVAAMFTIVMWFFMSVWWIARLFVRMVLAVAKPAMRYLAFLFLLVAIVALVADLTPSVSDGSRYSITSAGEHWNKISPLSLAAAKETVSGATWPWVWQMLQLVVLNLPTFFVFGAFGMLAAYAGRTRKILNVFTN